MFFVPLFFLCYLICRTDTFSDMYDSDEYVGKNPESVMDSETVHTPKKIKHRTRPKTIIDTESFISQDRRSLGTGRDTESFISQDRPRRSLGTGRDRHSKRRHLETNEDVFSIRRSYENVEDVHMSGSDGHSYGDSDRNVEIDIKETDYR